MECLICITMSASSDLLRPLSTTSPLPAATTFTSDKIIAGQYSSLDVLVYADTDTNVYIEFSGDGLHWDLSILKSFLPGQGSTESTSVLSKWMRILVENPGPVPQTELRVFTYGSINSTVITTNLALTNNLPQAVSITNIDGHTLLVDGAILIYQNGLINSIRISGVGGIFYSNGMIFDSGGSNMDLFYTLTSDVGTNYLPGGGVGGLTLSSGTGAPLPAPGLGVATYRSSRLTHTGTGGKIYLTAVANWLANAFIGGIRPTMFLGTGTGVQYSNSGALVADPYAAFGYISLSVAPHPITSLEVGFNSGGIPPITFAVAQPDWNLDPADGTGVLPAIDATLIFVGMRIIVDLWVVTWQIMHPSTGRWISVHRYSHPPQSSPRPLFGPAGYGMNAFMQTEYTSSDIFKQMYVNALLLQQAQGGVSSIPMRVDTFQTSPGVPVALVETFLGAFVNRSLTTPWPTFGALNRQCVLISNIHLNGKTVGVVAPVVTTFGFIRVYRVDRNQLTIFSVPVDVSSTTPLQFALVTAYTPGLFPPRRLIKTMCIPDGFRINSQDSLLMASDGVGNTQANLTDWILTPNACMLFTYIVPDTAWRFSLSADIITGV